jgi:putative ABC transport system ATP-binding protein
VWGLISEKREPGSTNRWSSGDKGHLIDLQQVEKTYLTASGPFPALRGVYLRIDAGEFVSIIGRSGSGKSTLINMITGIDRPTAGKVLVDGTVVPTLSEEQIAAWRGRTIGVVFQFFQLLPALTAIENVLLPMDLCGIYRPAERPERAMGLLEQVGMTSQAHKFPSALSGGQMQSVAIARALATDPPILMADEPTGNLDSNTAEAVFRLFANLVRDGKTVLTVTHDEHLAQRAARTVTIADGMIVADTTNPASPTSGEPPSPRQEDR